MMNIKYKLFYAERFIINCIVKLALATTSIKQLLVLYDLNFNFSSHCISIYLTCTKWPSVLKDPISMLFWKVTLRQF
jgi:hypothetical protein